MFSFQMFSFHLRFKFHFICLTCHHPELDNHVVNVTTTGKFMMGFLEWMVARDATLRDRIIRLLKAHYVMSRLDNNIEVLLFFVVFIVISSEVIFYSSFELRCVRAAHVGYPACWRRQPGDDVRHVQGVSLSLMYDLYPYHPGDDV